MQDLPPLSEAYALYLVQHAPTRPMSALNPLADFVDLLREQQVDASYTDEDWIAFLLPFTNGDEDEARDLWDGLLCQPSYDH
jgi:hypothetical protein